MNKKADVIIIGKEKRTFRMVIHERNKSDTTSIKSRCVTLYDYDGKYTAEKLQVMIKQMLRGKKRGRKPGAKNKIKKSKIGRPKGSKNKVKKVKRGRPKGSKNRKDTVKAIIKAGWIGK